MNGRGAVFFRAATPEDIRFEGGALGSLNLSGGLLLVFLGWEVVGLRILLV